MVGFSGGDVEPLVSSVGNSRDHINCRWNNSVKILKNELIGNSLNDTIPGTELIILKIQETSYVKC